MHRTEDARFMREALALAAQAIGLSDPNPRVGCIIADAEGRVIGRGHTQEAGGPHAEIVALRDAAARAESVAGATAYVTLEPCAHYGRTPPCCEALIAAGLGRVVVALTDPDPRVSGRGTARLRQAGIEVTELSAGPLQSQARELNIGFLKRMRDGKPWVRLNASVSLDGRTTLRYGSSGRIAGEAARMDGLTWRKRASAVLTEIGTATDDDPRLDAGQAEGARQPLRAIVDSHLQISPDARILSPPARVLLYTAGGDPGRHAMLTARGAEIRSFAGAAGGVDLCAVLDDLGERGINELHVEAGARLNGALLRQGLVDELLVYMAPLLLGPGLDLAAVEDREHGVGFEFHDVALISPDLRLIARCRGCT